MPQGRPEVPMILSKIAKLRHQSVPAGELPRCERCENVELRRQGRTGLLERAVLPRFGFFPWECGLCRTVTYRKQRSAVKAPASPTVSAPEAPRKLSPVVPAARLTVYTPAVKRSPAHRTSSPAALPGTLSGSLTGQPTVAAR